MTTSSQIAVISVRAVLAKDENAVKIGPERIEARLLLAAEGGSGVAQVYSTG
jgi:hypothetical protein